MDAESAEALEVLRDVWRAQAQTVADLDDSCESHCRKMTDAGVGFDDYAAGDETDRRPGWGVTASSARPAAWLTSCGARPRPPTAPAAERGPSRAPGGVPSDRRPAH